MATELKLMVEDDVVAEIEQAFGLDASAGSSATEGLQNFCRLAVSFYASMVFGKTRYRSTTEMNLEVVQQLFAVMLPGEAPTTDVLFNKFNLPYGQAAYIARVLMEKDVAYWRSSAKRDLRKSVDALIAANAKVSANDAKDTTVQDDITLGAVRELKTICNKLKETDSQGFLLPDYGASNGNYRRVKLGLLTLRRIGKLMADEQLGA